jgi:hypothetical protein
VSNGLKANALLMNKILFHILPDASVLNIWTKFYAVFYFILTKIDLGKVALYFAIFSNVAISI